VRSGGAGGWRDPPGTTSTLPNLPSTTPVVIVLTCMVPPHTHTQVWRHFLPGVHPAHPGAHPDQDDRHVPHEAGGGGLAGRLPRTGEGGTRGWGLGGCICVWGGGEPGRSSTGGGCAGVGEREGASGGVCRGDGVGSMWCGWVGGQPRNMGSLCPCESPRAELRCLQLTVYTSMWPRPPVDCSSGVLTSIACTPQATLTARGVDLSMHGHGHITSNTPMPFHLFPCLLSPAPNTGVGAGVAADGRQAGAAAVAAHQHAPAGRAEGGGSCGTSRQGACGLRRCGGPG
jgi:hypothetical protein